jgi:hypothetical protein
MKIADYGKAITSYIESPTTAQKLKSKESAENLLAEVDFSGMTVPQLRILYERYTGVGAPKDSKELIIELKRLMKNLDQDGVPFATGGRVHLAEGSEDIVEPSKSMKVDTTTKGPDLFTLQDFKNKAEIYVLALHNRALPLDNIKSALNKFTKQGLNDDTFTVDEAIKVVQNLKFEVEDRAQKQRLRDNIIAGTGTVKREDFAGGTKLMDEYLGVQKEYQKAVDDGFQGTFEEFLRYKSSGSFAEGGRAKFGDGTITPVLNLGSNVKKDPKLVKLFNEGNLYHLRLGKDKVVSYGTKEELKQVFKNRTTAGGDVRADLELKKYKKNFLPRNKFLTFLQDKGIQATTVNPKVFAQRYGLKFEPNPYFKSDVIVDISKLKNKDFVDSIIKRQVASGFGTEEQKLQFRKFDDDSVMRRYFNKLRRNMQKKFSVRKIEELLAANKASGLNLSHMDDLYSQYVTTRNIGYVPKDFNTQDLDRFDKEFRKIYKKRNNLFKNKTKGWEEKVAKLNKDGITLAKASDGFKQFQVKKPDGKTRVVGVDLSKTVDPNDILKGKRIKDLSDEDIDLLIENKNKIIKGTSQATWKKLLKSFGKKLPLAGAILGVNEVANAVEMGVTNPVDLFAAYQISADAALEGKRYREDPEFRKQSRAKTFSIPLDEGTFEAIEEQTSPFGKYNDQIKNINLP